MKIVLSLSLSLFVLLMDVNAQTAAELSEIWEKQHVSNILPSNVRHKDLKSYLDGLKKIGLKVNEAGRSYSNREIYQVEFGSGPLKVFMWSQMHGDEPTATSALIDMFTILQKNRDKDWVKEIESMITIRAVPMLNPDGTDMYLRRNNQGLDINRDALNLKSPEAVLLKRLRDEWSPHIGFNLHNQNALTTAGSSNKQAAISFLVVYGDAEKTASEGHDRNKRLTAAMTQALNNFIPGHIGRYDDGFAPTAFGDNFSAWGTPVILIETGALHGKDEMFLVKMNFVAFLTSLRSLADGSEKILSPSNYELLPNNSSGRLTYFVFRNASIISREKPKEITSGDIAATTDRRRAEFTAPTTIRQIGNLNNLSGLEEYDVSDYYLIGRFQPLKTGSFAEILFYRKNRAVDWTVSDIEKQYPPDAVFSLGKWRKPLPGKESNE
ncbi:MAG: peptidase M14 [Saprospiraceae bacterium]|nr:peptidase M14 [Pyrinomonadaceae bacterium]